MVKANAIYMDLTYPNLTWPILANLKNERYLNLVYVNLEYKLLTSNKVFFFVIYLEGKKFSFFAIL